MKEILDTIMEETKKVKEITERYEALRILKKSIKDPDISILENFLEKKESEK